jgi:FMN phosphatase YigB (HAD superfamily)
METVMVIRSLSCLLLSAAGVILITTTPTHALQTPCTPDNTTVAFDIDNVLLKRSEPMYQTLWNYRWDLAKNIIRIGLLYNVGQLIYQGATGGSYYELFRVQAPRLAEMVKRITHEKTPLAGMPELINQIHARGFRMAIASNMSAADYVFYQQKFPELFGTFAYAKVIHYDKAGKALCKKPSLEYFKQLKDELTANGLAKENLVFIDDRLNNVDASLQEGLHGILFENATQLQAELKNIGIL